MRRRIFGTAALFVLTVGNLLLSSQLALAQFTQQGPKLLGTGAVGAAEQGYSVALSADGNTALLGGRQDNGDAGAAWVFTRSGGVWSQQGSKLVGTGGGGAEQGYAVALSADGNTALVGGPFDNSAAGAVWVFTRSSGVWSQQGSKLVGTGAASKTLGASQGWSVALSADGNTALVGGPDDSDIGASWVFTRSGGVWSQQGSKLVGSGAAATPDAAQGSSVALSADGNTALVGGPIDNFGAGATWVFTRSGGAWFQQGSKLVGTGAVNPAHQGYSVALSADGNTAIVGGWYDDNGLGAAWAFTRDNNGMWSQQGSKLVGTGAVNPALQGSSVALSANGNIAVVGGSGDNSPAGAVWVFTRSSGVWSQQGSKLVGTGAVNPAQQGTSVALSADGNTLLEGGSTDNADAGAAWVFAQPHFNMPGTHDFNDDGYSDIAWQDTNGNTAIWLMSSAQVVSSSGIGTVSTTWSIVGQRDFDGDGNYDLLWRDTDGNTAIWFMKGTQVTTSASIGNIPTNWSVIGTGDFDGDGKGDILWRDGTGNVAVWLMSGSAVTTSASLGNVPTNWSVVGIGDFNADGQSDILWRDGSGVGNNSIWFMNGTGVRSATAIPSLLPVYFVLGTGDFDGDGNADIVWRDLTGTTFIWLMSGAVVSQAGSLGNVPWTWLLAQTGDYNGDGMSDFLWRDTSGNTSIWFMNGIGVASTGFVGNISTNWAVQSVNAE